MSILSDLYGDAKNLLRQGWTRSRVGKELELDMQTIREIDNKPDPIKCKTVVHNSVMQTRGGGNPRNQAWKDRKPFELDRASIQKRIDRSPGFPKTFTLD